VLWIVDLADPLRPSLLGRWWHAGQAPGAEIAAGQDLGRTLHEARPLGDRLFLCYLDGRPAAQSNDVFVDDRGLIYLTDRWGGGLDILEFAGA
jgi:hypothetical protein